jgi:hypothetical protein
MTPPPAPGGQPAPAQKTGCGKIACIGCSILSALGVIAVFILVFFVFRLIKSSDVYKEARDRATTDPRVIAVLGEPITTGFWVSGSVKINNDQGTANIDFPISGPKGSARVHAEATRDERAWHYNVLRVKPESGPAIDLAEPEAPPAEPQTSTTP